MAQYRMYSTELPGMKISRNPCFFDIDILALKEMNGNKRMRTKINAKFIRFHRIFYASHYIWKFYSNTKLY